MIKFRYIRYFVSVAEELSFSRAAERLHISQSALSRQIRLFEEFLGVRLFDRIGRRIELTAAGRDLLQRSRVLLNDAGALAVRAKSHAEGSGGIIRIGATPQTLESVLSQFLVHFQKLSPAVQVELYEDGAARLEQRVLNGELDLATGGLTPGKSLQGRSLFPLGVLAILPDNNRLFGRAHVDIAELAHEQLLLLRSHFMTRQIFDGVCQVLNIRPGMMIESGSPHCLLELVRARHGIAIVPSSVLLGDMLSNAAPIRYEEKLLGFYMSVIWDPRRFFTPAARLFVEELASSTLEDYPGKSFAFDPADEGFAIV